MWCGAPAKKNPKKKMYQRPDGLFEKVMTIDGKRVAFRAKTEKEVERKILAYQEKKESGPLFSEVADQWKEEHFPALSYNTLRCYTAPYQRILGWFGGELIKDIHAPDITPFILHLSAKRFSQKTVNTHLSVLSMIFDYAIRQGIIFVNPTIAIQVPKGLPKRKRSAPEPSDIRIVQQSKGKTFGLFALLLLYTGLRRGEALALTYGDIDLSAKLIHVRRTLYWQHNRPMLKSPKTDAGIRDVVLLDVLASELPKGESEKYLFSDDGGNTPLSDKRARRLWELYQRETGLKITPHELRHAYATLLFESGVGVKEAQDLLGHANAAVTNDIYTHIRKSYREDLIQKLNASFAKNQ